MTTSVLTGNKPNAFDRLNPAQHSAARYGERSEAGDYRAGPLLIIAGAGTGKTNTLAHRVAHLVLEGVSPHRLLLLTFTRRAAQEMTRRAQKIVATALDEQARGAGTASAPALHSVSLPWSGTFHSIANRLIRRHCSCVGLDPNFTVLDRGDAADLMDLARHELRLSSVEKRFPRKDTCLAIYSHRVSTQGTLQQTLEQVFPWCAEWADELTQLFRA
ncbi:MAG TPA: ATP-dependent helicase, partial [Burkholderiales bacterium]|nr:ATP-dependent helicase [Burkholderiales bacterium]